MSQQQNLLSKISTLLCGAVASGFIAYKLLSQKSRRFREIYRLCLVSTKGVGIVNGSYWMRYHLPFIMNNLFILHGLQKGQICHLKDWSSLDFQFILFESMNMFACIGISRIMDGYLLPNTIELYERTIFDPVQRQKIAYFDKLNDIIGREVQFIPELVNEILIFSDFQNDDEFESLLNYLNNDLRKALVDKPKILQYRFFKEWMNDYYDLFDFEDICQSYNQQVAQITAYYATLPNTRNNREAMEERMIAARAQKYFLIVCKFTSKCVLYGRWSILMLIVKNMMSVNHDDDKHQEDMDVAFGLHCFFREPIHCGISLSFLLSQSVFRKLNKIF